MLYRFTRETPEMSLLIISSADISREKNRILLFLSIIVRANDTANAVLPTEGLAPIAISWPEYNPPLRCLSNSSNPVGSGNESP